MRSFLVYPSSEWSAEATVRELVQVLVVNSARFCVDPMPDDVWEIRVRTDKADLLRHTSGVYEQDKAEEPML